MIAPAHVAHDPRAVLSIRSHLPKFAHGHRTFLNR
jgi:hypothetical protein